VTSVTDTPAAATTTETTILYSSPLALGDALRVQSSLSGLAVLGYDPGLVSPNAAADGAGATSASTIDVGSVLPTSQSADVVVVTGSNFAVNPPTSSPTTVPGTTPSTSSTSSPSSTAVGSVTTTTVPGPLADNPNLSAPSGSTEALEPWDPRSCSASGGEGP
jgi:hypothetical protein